MTFNKLFNLTTFTKFKHKDEDFTVVVKEVKEKDNILEVRITSKHGGEWNENWNLAHTRTGMEDGIYVEIKVPINTRIRFLRELSQEPNEEMPGFLFARKDDLGTITNYNSWEGYWCTKDGWPNAFGIERKDFEILE